MYEGICTFRNIYEPYPLENKHGSQKLVICRCFSFSQGSIFRFQGCNSIFPIIAWRSNIPYMEVCGIPNYRAPGISNLKVLMIPSGNKKWCHYDLYIDLVSKPNNLYIDDTGDFCLQDLISIPHSLIRKDFFCKSHQKPTRFLDFAATVTLDGFSRRREPCPGESENFMHGTFFWNLHGIHLDNFFAAPTLTENLLSQFLWNDLFASFLEDRFSSSVSLERESVSFSCGRRSFFRCFIEVGGFVLPSGSSTQILCKTSTLLPLRDCCLVKHD